MFGNLVESGSHRAEARRKGKYFLGALVSYGLLLAAAGVGSIYAYNVQLEDRTDYELVALMNFKSEQPERRVAAARPSAASPAGSADAPRANPVVVRDLVVDNPNLSGRPVAPADARVLAPGVPHVIDPNAIAPPGLGPSGVVGGGGGGPAGGAEGGPGPVDAESPPALPPPATPIPAQTPGPTGPLKLTSTVISGKAIEKPAPPYPPLARQAGAQGMVPVLVLVDERGQVVSAKASGGHPLLRQAAVQAAYRATFEPTVLNGRPVKVTGVITYNFLLQ